MLRLYTENLDAERLRSRLESLLDHRFAPRPNDLGLSAPAPMSPLRRILRHMPMLRRLANGFTAWKLSGWSTRWLVLRAPILGPLASRIWGALTQRSFRLHVLAELGQLGTQQHQLRLDLERLQTAMPRGGPSLLEALTDETRLLREQLDRADERLRRFERRVRLDGNSDHELFPAWYLALEHTFRGESADVEARLANYLPHLTRAQAGSPDRPVLDLGCGRGEWLALLARQGLIARGVDCNAAMLAQVRERGLDVVEDDLLTFLRAADADSWGAVTAFQVIEHLDHDTLLELFREAARVLRPGGILLLETPNPENLQVAAYSFWLDPTHVRPLPPPLLAHTAAWFGFADIRIERSRAWPDALRLEDPGPAARHLEKLMFSEQDYALIARKPDAQHVAPALAES